MSKKNYLWNVRVYGAECHDEGCRWMKREDVRSRTGSRTKAEDLLAWDMY